VNQDGTGDFTIIQTAIDSCSINDTIRVYPGIYYENLFIDKSLSLVSNYEFTGNENDIISTILDGDQQSSVIRLEGEDDDYIDVYICGFIIQNGTGWHADNGFFPHKQGGGIRSENVLLNLKKNFINNNRAYSGGGLYLKNTYTNLSGNIISKNNAYSLGGGMLLHDSSNITFDDQSFNSIYLNFTGRGADIAKSEFCPLINVIVDTFTVSDPDFFHIYAYDTGGRYQPDEIIYSIQNAKIEQVERDLFVSADGDDHNSGFTAAEPLQNISYALALIKADSLHPRTIHVADGLYSPGLNGQYFPLHMKSYVSVVGESMENTILDAEAGIHIIHARDFIEGEYLDQPLVKYYTVKNFKMIHGYWGSYIHIQKNAYPTFENIICADSYNIDYCILENTRSYGLNIENMVFRDNICGRAIINIGGYEVSNFHNVIVKDSEPHEDPEIQKGGGITISNNGGNGYVYTANLVNCQITNVSDLCTIWPFSGSAFACGEGGKANLVNCTISDNTTLNGAGVLVCYASELNIYNSILYGNTLRELIVDGSYDHVNTLSVHNSLVEGGYSNILNVDANNYDWDDETNLDEDPLFAFFGEVPYSISAGSPCIDAGTLDLPAEVELPAYDLAGNPRIVGETVDMGAFEFQGNGISSEELEVRSINMSVYPNPFNPNNRDHCTSIKFNLLQGCDVSLDIYNVKGQKVKSLMDAYASRGEYTCRWDGRDENGKQVSSGQYICKLMVDEEMKAVRKIVILK